MCLPTLVAGDTQAHKGALWGAGKALGCRRWLPELIYVYKAELWQGCGEIRTFPHGWWADKMVQLLWDQLGVFSKSETELLYDPAIPLLGLDPKELKARTSNFQFLQVFVCPCSQQRYSQWPKGGHNPGVHQQMSG